jgi:predicted RNase H-like HicB family nuclease
MQKISIICQLFREDNQIISYCPQFNVSSFGDTPEEARLSLREAVDLFLEECERMGTLKEVLEEAGYKFDTSTQIWRPPTLIESKELEVAVA